MGTTTPDGLPWPEYADPAAVPQDMYELAGATQAALDRKQPLSPVTSPISLAAGWFHNAGVSYGGWNVHRVGRMVVASGTILRGQSSLSVTDNVRIVLGTIPEGFRPSQSLRAPAAWVARDTSASVQLSTGSIDIITNGEVGFYPNFTATIEIQSHYISIAGLSWVTP